MLLWYLKTMKSGVWLRWNPCLESPSERLGAWFRVGTPARSWGVARISSPPLCTLGMVMKALISAAEGWSSWDPWPVSPAHCGGNRLEGWGPQVCSCSLLPSVGTEALGTPSSDPYLPTQKSRKMRSRTSSVPPLPVRWLRCLRARRRTSAARARSVVAW